MVTQSTIISQPSQKDWKVAVSEMYFSLKSKFICILLCSMHFCAYATVFFLYLSLSLLISFLLCTFFMHSVTKFKSRCNARWFIKCCLLYLNTFLFSNKDNDPRDSYDRRVIVVNCSSSSLKMVFFLDTFCKWNHHSSFVFYYFFFIRGEKDGRMKDLNKNKNT